MSNITQEKYAEAMNHSTPLVELFNELKKSGRKASLAKTNLEQAMLWFKDALSDEFAPEEEVK